MQELTLAFPRGPVTTKVFSGAGMFVRAAGFIAATWPGRRVAAIADAAVAALYGADLIRTYKTDGLSTQLFTFPPKKTSKCHA